MVKVINFAGKVEITSKTEVLHLGVRYIGEVLSVKTAFVAAYKKGRKFTTDATQVVMHVRHVQFV